MCLGQIRQRSEDTLIAGMGCDCITDPQLKLLQRALQMYILTCRVKVSRQLKSEKKKDFWTSGKPNLETGKWIYYTVKNGFEPFWRWRDYWVIVSVLHGGCPYGPRIYSALITDCGCPLINNVIPKDKNRKGFWRKRLAKALWSHTLLGTWPVMRKVVSWYFIMEGSRLKDAPMALASPYLR